MPVKRTTVWKLRKEALDAIKNESQSDVWWDPSPAEWSAEAYPFLLALNRFCVSGIDRGRNTIGGDLESSHLTFKEAKWGARSYMVLGDAPIDLAYQVFVLFAGRESVQEVDERPIALDDLVGFLEYKPWESPDAHETYELACELGRVPRIRDVGSTAVQEKSARITAELTPSATFEHGAVLLECLLAIQEQIMSDQDGQTWRKLRNIVERADILRQVANEKITEILNHSEGYARIDSRDAGPSRKAR